MTINNFLLQHQFIKTIFRNQNKQAIIVDSVSYTYLNVYSDCIKLCAYFKKNNVIRGDRIIIKSGNSYLTVIAYWATVLCDAIACVIDDELASKIFENVAKKIDPKLIIENNHDDLISVLNNRIESGNYLIENSFQNTEQDLVMIIHTSGSTGEPKGVMLSHRNVIAAIESISSYLLLSNDDVILSVLPLHFDYGLYQMLLAFSVGATLVLEKNALFPHLIANQILRYQITVLPCVPQLVQIFYCCAQQFSCDFSSIKTVTNTGENLSVSYISKIQMLFPGAKIFSMYGLTECKRCSYVPPSMLHRKSESIGIPMPNLEMWIQDKDGHRVDANVQGELIISGPTVMQGYWKNPQATCDKIRIMENGKRILLTGDYATMDSDGYFYFMGRGDSVVKFKGAKFNCHDYVKKLGTLPELNRSYLFFTDFDEASKKLIVCAEIQDQTCNQDDLKKKILSVFPGVQKPNQIYFMSQFPALSNGKLDKSKLEAMAGTLK